MEIIFTMKEMEKKINEIKIRTILNKKKQLEKENKTKKN